MTIGQGPFRVQATYAVAAQVPSGRPGVPLSQTGCRFCLISTSGGKCRGEDKRGVNYPRELKQKGLLRRIRPGDGAVAQCPSAGLATPGDGRNAQQGKSVRHGAQPSAIGRRSWRTRHISKTMGAAGHRGGQEMLIGWCRFRISSIPETPVSGTMTLTCSVASSL